MEVVVPVEHIDLTEPLFAITERVRGDVGLPGYGASGFCEAFDACLSPAAVGFAQRPGVGSDSDLGADHA